MLFERFRRVISKPRVQPSNWWKDFKQDFRYVVRGFYRAPGFAIIIMLTFTFGIGANTTVFTLVDAVMLKMLPVRDPASLIQAFHPQNAASAELDDSFSYRSFVGMSKAENPYVDLFADVPIRDSSVRINGGPEERAHNQAVSGNYFEKLSVHPVLGRTLSPEDDEAYGAHPVAVISYSMWQQRFRKDPGVIGQKLRLGNNLLQIVGVAQPRFFGLEIGKEVDFWTPLTIEPAGNLDNPDLRLVRIFGRLRPGASTAQASGPLQVAFHQQLVEEAQRHARPDLPRELVEKFTAQKLAITEAARGVSYLRRDYGRPLVLSMIIVAFILIIACINIANLLLAKGTARQREMAVRLSLGATRSRLVRQMLVESLIPAIIAAGAALWFSRWAAPAVVRSLSPPNLQIQLPLDLDAKMLGFTAGAAICTLLIFGLVPALRSSSVNIRAGLKGGVRMTDLAGARLTKGLVISQVALSLPLLVSAVLLLRTFLNLISTDAGFDRHNVVIARIEIEGVRPDEQLVASWEDLRRRAESIPGVESAGLSTFSLFSGTEDKTFVRSMGSSQVPQDPSCILVTMSENFFRTMSTRILAGRDFEPRDFNLSAPPVAIINEKLAHKLFPNENPIGKNLSWLGDNPPRWKEIIGLAQDVKYSNLRAPASPLLYEPYTVIYRYPNPSVKRWMSLEIRGRAEIASLLPALKREAGQEFTVHDLIPQSVLVDNSFIGERLMADLTTCFALVSLILAMIGLYGIMSYTVAQRTAEIGIRMALGATPGKVTSMVLRDSLKITGAGIALGTLAAVAGARLLGAFLFGVSARDPATLAGVIAVLLVSALVAAYVPARRASHTDPVIAIRQE